MDGAVLSHCNTVCWHRYQEDGTSSAGMPDMCLQTSRKQVVAVELVGEDRVRQTQATLAGAGVSSVVSLAQPQ